MDNKVLQDTQMENINKFAVFGHGLEAIVIVAAYILEFVKGNRGMSYILVVAVFALVPVALEIVCYLRDHRSKAIKHILSIGFAAFYTLILFTASINLVFVYVFPLLLVITLYNDTRYSLLIAIGTVFENFLMAVIGGVTGTLGFQNLAAAEIQVLSMVIIAVYTILSAGISRKNEQLKLEAIESEKERTDGLLKNVTAVSDGMSEGIEDIYNKVQSLQEATMETQEAMGEVMKGSTETASAVQQQLIRTQEIEEKTNGVDSALSVIQNNMNHTMDVIEEGSEGMLRLVSQVEKSVKDGERATADLENLNSYIGQMNSIVEIINEIASQTSLLALNASIEAARAGEAGRGFSVVASEISSMADQTTGATKQISGIIKDVSDAVASVVAVVKEMIGAINDEKNLTENTRDHFNDISKCTQDIEEHVNVLMESIKGLNSANREISESIQTISAISEEVSAHSNETFDSQSSNTDTLNAIMQTANSLKDLTSKL